MIYDERTIVTPFSDLRCIPPTEQGLADANPAANPGEVAPLHKALASAFLFGAIAGVVTLKLGAWAYERWIKSS